jgi:hypothetical protein
MVLFQLELIFQLGEESARRMRAYSSSSSSPEVKEGWPGQHAGIGVKLVRPLASAFINP